MLSWKKILLLHTHAVHSERRRCMRSITNVASHLSSFVVDEGVEERENGYLQVG